MPHLKPHSAKIIKLPWNAWETDNGVLACDRYITEDVAAACFWVICR